MVRVSLGAGCLVLTGAVAGCTPGHELARVRAARELSCPEANIRVKWIGGAPGNLGDVYMVNACGVRATYVCNEAQESCLKESDDRVER
ncbi:MAG: hypothetical protein HY744_21610 [Deltaproteobacteria bacterium]|nr:hypothetical protein [Deltaproteobacteria bacterium]